MLGLELRVEAGVREREGGRERGGRERERGSVAVLYGGEIAVVGFGAWIRD